MLFFGEVAAVARGYLLGDLIMLFLDGSIFSEILFSAFMVLMVALFWSLVTNISSQQPQLQLQNGAIFKLLFAGFIVFTLLEPRLRWLFTDNEPRGSLNSLYTVIMGSPSFVDYFFLPKQMITFLRPVEPESSVKSSGQL